LERRPPGEKERVMGFFKKVSKGLSRSRSKFKERMNVLLDRGPDLDEGFWDQLEETLILSDVGGSAAASIVEGLRDQATRDALPDAYAVLDLLNDQIAATFTPGGEEILGGDPACVVFVGINGTGKTTTVGKLAKEAHDAGRTVVLGSADTFRAAAIEQLEVWARRADVEVVERERGADPASVCYDTIERGEQKNADLVLIDTAGRLHNSADLMRELEKVVSVVRKRSTLPVYIVLVIDATTGQNGLAQAREFKPHARSGRHHHHQARRDGQGRHRARRVARAGAAHSEDRRRRGHRRPARFRRARVLERAHRRLRRALRR
jgi:fused signal recognition particle receptor